MTDGNITDGFNDNSGRSLEGMRAHAGMLLTTYYMIRNPAQKLYERTAAAVNEYADALFKKHGSLGNYLAAEEQSLQTLAARKGVQPDGKILSFDEGLTKSIQRMDEALANRKQHYFSPIDFGELFLLRIPAAIDALNKKLNDMPDAPTRQLPLDFGPKQ